jgi:protein tyrosine phosphatase (PTP) superfamily phosphohydrolase (DUF442 family)
MKSDCDDPLSEIHNYLRITDQVGTAGQPTAEEFALIAREGFEVVINLALPISDNAIPNEGGIVTGLGMSYVHIPVDFEAPQLADYRMFSGMMSSCGERRVFVHCTANKRVAAFVYLHRVEAGGVPEETARRDLEKIWRPDGLWAELIDSVLG